LVSATAGVVNVEGGTGNVVALGGLKSRSRRRKYTTYTEPTAGTDLAHAPRKRLADVLEFHPAIAPTPLPLPKKPSTRKLPAATVEEKRASAALSPEMELLAQEITRRVVTALTPLLAPEDLPEDDEEELIRLLLRQTAA
jgi:hypothetical protein